MAVAQWVRRWNSGQRMVQAEGSSLGGDTNQTFFSAMIFISVLLGLVDFSDSRIVMSHSRSNSCCQQNFKCFGMHLLSLGLFS